MSDKTTKPTKKVTGKQNLSDIVVKSMVRKVILGGDHRAEVLAVINAKFLEAAIEFFGKVAQAKLRNQPITLDWYKKEFLNKELDAKEITLNSGLNTKSIRNSYGTTKKQLILEVTEKHYDQLLESIEILANDLTFDDQPIEILLTIKLNGVACDLTVSESLIVINTLAVKRAALRGGIWSSLGKQVEKPLAATLCEMFSVPAIYYDQTNNPINAPRQVDYYLTDAAGKKHPCEIKLMGLGNPENTDGALARETEVFIFDSLTPDGTIREQLETHKEIVWVELKAENGYLKFEEVLKKLDIPYKLPSGDISELLDIILKDKTDLVPLDLETLIDSGE